jgi:hypothetical protein
MDEFNDLREVRQPLSETKPAMTCAYAALAISVRSLDPRDYFRIQNG